jgi:L-iditol 2-dehydrogenase
MKAVKLYEPGNIKVEDIDVPVLLENEVLIEVKAVGVCGSDIPRALYKGAYYEGLTLGHEFSGIIVKKGESVQEWEEGNRVTVAPLVPCMKCEQCQEENYSLCSDYNYYGSRTDGAMAKYIKVNPNNILLLPDNVSFEAGAMVDPAANAIHGLWSGNVKKGDKVAVFGLGAIGLFAIQFAKVLGASQVVAVDIHNEKLELAKSLGADVTINSSLQNPIKVIQEELNYLDFAIDTSGSPIAQDQAVSSCGKHGRVVFLGISNQTLELSSNSVNKILRHELTIRGSWNSFSAPFPGREWTYSIELMGEGKLVTEPLVSHRFEIDEAPEVFNKIKNKEIVFNKIMFFPN